MSAEGFVFLQHFIRREIPLSADTPLFIATKQEKMPILCKMPSLVWCVQISEM